jgi:rod shape-determining protein MreC
MRNLIQFVSKNSIVFLFLFLQAICFALLFQYNDFHKTTFVNSTNSVTGWFLEVRSNFTDYFNLRDANEQLAKENAEMHTVSTSSYITLFNNYTTVSDTIYHQQYEYVSAKVIKISTNKKNNTITINKGSSSGITQDMGVICSNGIVGKVKDVSPHFATVIPVIDSRFRVSSKIKRSNNFGTLIWNDKSPRTATLNDISNNVKLNIGDTITSGYTNLFPDNIMVGTLKKFYTEPGSSSHTIKVKLSTDFTNLYYVYVVRNLLKGEQKSLEVKAEEKDGK